MKIPRIINAVGHIDDDLIAASDNKRKKNTWIRWGSAAACFAVLAAVGALLLPSVLNGGEESGSGRYKDLYIQSSGESAIIWQWEYLADYERYTATEIEGISYYSRGRAVSQELVGGYIGNYPVKGYDELKDEWHTISAEIYRLNNIVQEQFVAVKLDNTHYVFMNDTYAPPATLGGLMEDIALSEITELRLFSDKTSTPDSSHFMLEDDDYIWQVLNECKSAPFIEDQLWSTSGREYLSFTISSEALGVYKNAMYITEDGYLWTNAFSWQYLFLIGEDAAQKIISYAKENSVPAEYEPYMSSAVGTVAEITVEHILIDDSVLCKDPKDGVIYRIPLDDICISRYVDSGIIETGDTVQVSYIGDIDAENGNTIDGAVYIAKAIISDDAVAIPE